MWMSGSCVCAYLRVCVPQNRPVCVENAAVHQNSLHLIFYDLPLTWRQLCCDFKNSSVIAQQAGQDFHLLSSSTCWQEHILYNNQLFFLSSDYFKVLVLKLKPLNSKPGGKKEHQLTECHQSSSDDLTVTWPWMQQVPIQASAVSPWWFMREGNTGNRLLTTSWEILRQKLSLQGGIRRETHIHTHARSEPQAHILLQLCFLSRLFNNSHKSPPLKVQTALPH